MRTRGHLTCRPCKQQPSQAAREAIAQIQRVLIHGCTAEEVAQARAELEALNMPRQPQLALKVQL
jgi:isoaspartyl peptidase/L-asparaginase-like protein (Ntn-hydrolase superfamily)